MQLRTSHAHEEGGIREWSIATTELVGRDGHVERLRAQRVRLERDSAGASRFVPVPGSDLELEVDLVLLAMGFMGPEPSGLLTSLGVALDARGNVRVDHDHMTNVPGVFAAGDVHRGASLIVWAIREGRDAAAGVDRLLQSRAATCGS